MKLQLRFLLLLSALLLAVQLTGCGGSDSEPADSNVIKLADRQYTLVLPAGYRPEQDYKLLLAFHGSGGSSADMQRTAGFSSYSNDYIVAYPQAGTIEWNEGCNCNIANRLGIDDLGFVDQVIADISAKHRVNQDEIYAAGFSQGGLFTQNLACNRSSRFKAFAVVAAPMSGQLWQSCAPAEPVSIMMVMGKNDSVLPYNGYTHSNFGLVSAPQAIARFASLNNSLPLAQRQTLAADQVELLSYSNGAQKAELFSIKQGQHQWTFSPFDTSAEILTFFQQLDTPRLPEASEVVQVDDKRFHVRLMGEQHAGPAVVLLAGPNENYHSDSAWFSLLQPVLADKYRVYSIDRLGNGFSDAADDVSYRRFADDLAAVLQTVNEQQVVIVAMASASISARLFYENHHQAIDIKAMLYIDPDVPLANSLSIYQGYPADWYLANLEALIPHLASGAWTERTADKLQAERSHIKSLVGDNPLMDWQYFDLISQQRLLIRHQQSRAREIAAYTADLNAYAALPMLTAIPVSVIDTDFEQAQIDANPENAEQLLLWQQESNSWNQQQAELANGQYIVLSNSDHLVALEQPEKIKAALDWLFAQLQLP
ncbi:alpha/beta hydrolase [Arsukibacterium indicum]|uniref:Alpha/beta hydrolase n=1 Tax=Arsukibacterium indicum TaxID=2848612 RepID=A0ABS6MND3_9GAMM|nr:alpha/beta hydrolase [Arsukibacterium indicum]MBV2130323.1 alpha/beta hydrolase [Arsukibacterium indicum]